MIKNRDNCRNRRLAANLPVLHRDRCTVCGHGDCLFEGENEPVSAAPLPHDYKNVHTIGELRSDRTDDPRDWSPRDLLVTVLRMIDAGEINPDTCCIVIADPEPAKPDFYGDEGVGIWTAGPSNMRTLAALDLALVLQRDRVINLMRSKKTD